MDMGIQRQVLVRSSSRLGYLDFGVNAKRINYIAAQVTALMCTKLNARKLNSTTLHCYLPPPLLLASSPATCLMPTS